jgi:hypothetical protein
MPNPTFDSEGVLECARSIRPFLPKLLGTEAGQIDRQLAELLEQAKTSQQVDTQILELLKSSTITQQWAAEFLSPELTSKGGYQSLPGYSSAQKLSKYICPVNNDFTQRRRAGEPIMSCPTCKVALVLADQSASGA